MTIRASCVFFAFDARNIARNFTTIIISQGRTVTSKFFRNYVLFFSHTSSHIP